MSQNVVQQNGPPLGRFNYLALRVALCLGLILLVYGIYRLAAGHPDTYEHQTTAGLLSATYLVLYPLGMLQYPRARRRLGHWLVGVGFVAGVAYAVLTFSRLLP